jgi:hypothetical protein
MWDSYDRNILNFLHHAYLTNGLIIPALKKQCRPTGMAPPQEAVVRAKAEKVGGSHSDLPSWVSTSIMKWLKVDV